MLLIRNSKEYKSSDYQISMFNYFHYSYYGAIYIKVIFIGSKGIPNNQIKSFLRIRRRNIHKQIFRIYLCNQTIQKEIIPFQFQLIEPVNVEFIV